VAQDDTKEKKEKKGLAGIFANAQASTVRHDQAKDGVKTKKCPACGGARPADSDLTVCSFCGKDLFP
jgi:hypothetical protein